MTRVFLLLSLSFLLGACSQPNKEIEQNTIGDSLKQKPATPAYNNRFVFDNKPGLIGVYELPAMLCLSLLDSAKMMDISYRVAKNYGILEEELKSIGAEIDGSPGQINYNNNPDNFKFECFLLIKNPPINAPLHSKIVFLEASNMLVYNYYGAYQELYTAYDKIRECLKSENLKQSGPVREFYVSDPSREPNPKNWLTRIMVPVLKEIDSK